MVKKIGVDLEFNPNGFTGKEICALSRYAGISDKVSMFGIFNFNHTKISTMCAWNPIIYNEISTTGATFKEYIKNGLVP